MAELFHSYAPLIAANETPFFPQPREKPSFYPKRTREDGGIDWARTTLDIHRLVRSVAPPYPCAFTRLRGGEVRLLGGQPFDTGLFHAAIQPGTVVDIQISLNRFVVKTGDGTYLATDFEGLRADELTIGDCFESVSQDAALAEIRTRYPDFVAADEREI